MPCSFKRRRISSRWEIYPLKVTGIFSLCAFSTADRAFTVRGRSEVDVDPLSCIVLGRRSIRSSNQRVNSSTSCLEYAGFQTCGFFPDAVFCPCSSAIFRHFLKIHVPKTLPAQAYPSSYKAVSFPILSSRRSTTSFSSGRTTRILPSSSSCSTSSNWRL